MTTRLENWHPVPDSKGRYRLNGEVWDHPTRPNGMGVVTTPIRGALGHVVTTSSGSTYRLGRPLPGWVELLESTGHPLDEAEPLTPWLPRDGR